MAPVSRSSSITVGERTAVATATAPTPIGPSRRARSSRRVRPGDTCRAGLEQHDGTVDGPDGRHRRCRPSLEGVALDFSFRGDFSNSPTCTELKRYVNVRGDRIDVEGRLMTIDNLVLEPTEEGSDELTAITATAYLAPVTVPTAGATPRPGRPHRRPPLSPRARRLTVELPRRRRSPAPAASGVTP